MATLEEVLHKFELLDPEVVFIVNSDRFTSKIGELSKKFDTDLNSAVLYSVVGDLRPEELANFLMREKDMEESAAKQAAADLISQVLKPMEDRLNLLNADPDKDAINKAQEKDMIRKIFAEGLVAELSEIFFIKNALNLRIFDILESDLNFKRELERLMYDNKELLTATPIIVGGRTAEPSISNWLKDFIEKQGTDDFNSVALSEYMTNSANTKKLSKEEREKLFDLLNLYRNLKFFPSTVEGKNIDDWQMIPFDLTEVKRFLAEQEKINAEAAEEEGEVKEENLTTEQKLAKYDWSKIVGIERRALLEELGVGLKDFVKWSNEKK